MSTEITLKETSAMARARELNRTNEKRLSACIENMSKDVEKSLQKLKMEGETTMKFMNKLKKSSGTSGESVEPTPEEHDRINMLINPPPKMSFALVDYKKKKLKELSKRLSVPNISSASEGNPVPLRTVKTWTSSTAKVLAQKKPPQIPRPTGRRRHSVESDDDSSDSDDVFTLQSVKKKAGQKKKELAKRRSSLPIILEKKTDNKKTNKFLKTRSSNAILPASITKTIHSEKL